MCRWMMREQAEHVDAFDGLLAYILFYGLHVILNPTPKTTIRLMLRVFANFWKTQGKGSDNGGRCR